MNAITNEQIKKWMSLQIDYYILTYFFQSYYYHFNSLFILNLNNAQGVPKFYRNHAQIYKLIKTH